MSCTESHYAVIFQALDKPELYQQGAGCPYCLLMLTEKLEEVVALLRQQHIEMVGVQTKLPLAENLS